MVKMKKLIQTKFNNCGLEYYYKLNAILRWHNHIIWTTSWEKISIGPMFLIKAKQNQSNCCFLMHCVNDFIALTTDEKHLVRICVTTRGNPQCMMIGDGWQAC